MELFDETVVMAIRDILEKYYFSILSDLNSGVNADNISLEIIVNYDDGDLGIVEVSFGEEIEIEEDTDLRLN
jgi:hypothetical protein